MGVMAVHDLSQGHWVGAALAMLFATPVAALVGKGVRVFFEVGEEPVIITESVLQRFDELVPAEQEELKQVLASAENAPEAEIALDDVLNNPELRTAEKDAAAGIEAAPTASSNLGRNESTPGAVADANFAQTKINKAQTFSPDGQKIYGEIAGHPITTVDDLAAAIRNKTINPSQVPVDYVVVEGKEVILNTRTSVALEEAGVPKSEWYGTNRTGQQVPGMPGKTFDELALEQTQRNGLPPTGTPTPPRR
jgi:hypothetical protein